LREGPSFQALGIARRLAPLILFLTDYIAEDADLQKLMADFGFVYFARKPGNG